jgi:hypothetical protein
MIPLFYIFEKIGFSNEQHNQNNHDEFGFSYLSCL